MDRIDGGKGNDYIEGNAGSDILTGGEGNDTLLGGAGDDILEGGADKDTYRFAPNSGTDHVIDDGNDSIEWKGIPIAGVYRWQEDRHAYLRQGDGSAITLTLDGQSTLTFEDGSKVILDRQNGIDGFKDDPYGIRLEKLPAQPPTTLEVLGDNVGEQPEGYTYTDELWGSNGNDHILALRGNDWVQAGEGDDIVVGGTQEAFPGYQDYLMGEAGNDLLYADEEVSLTALPSLSNFGGTVADNRIGDDLFGGIGNDILVGSDRRDVILGGAGKDFILGGAGDDQLNGDQDRRSGDVGFYFDRGTKFESSYVVHERGMPSTGYTTIGWGADQFTVYGAFYRRYLEASPGGDADTIYGGAGNDRIHGLVGNDILYGEDGEDVISGDEGRDYLYGGNGEDAISGGADADLIDGGAESDWIKGDDGDDQISGGKGDDFLYGGAGKDTYIYNKGDGTDTIKDTPAGIKDPEASILVLGGGIKKADVKFRLGSLHVDVGNGEGLHFEGFGPDTPDATPVISEIRFDDGSVMTYADILEQGFDLDGTDGDDVITGTAVTDRIDGKGGNDTLIAGAGNDVLTSGAGDDLLDGGSGADRMDGGVGNDTYHFDAGFGFDTISENDATEGNVDRIVFGAGIAPTDIVVSREGMDLVLSADDDNQIRVEGWFADGAHKVEYVEFEGGVFWTVNDLERPDNLAPVVGRVLTEQAASEDAIFSFTVPTDSFTDAGDVLTLSATLADGSALPSWLAFDAVNGVFNGTTANGDVGTLRVRVTATDLAGAAVAQVFALSVANTNDAPEIAQLLADGAAVQEEAFSYVLPADSFHDVDVGDVLVYSASLANGDPLPAWLGFDAATGVFSGSPANGDVGNLLLQVSATDLAGASANQLFSLTVVDVNDAPVVLIAPADQLAIEDTAFSWTLPAGSFADIDAGDVLSLAATQADGSPLPTWLGFDASSGTFTGTPANADVGTLALRVVATDLAGASTSASFSLSVANVNDAPMVYGEHGLTAEDTALIYSAAALLTNDSDIDPTLDVLSISAVGDAAHGTVSLGLSGEVVFIPDADYHGEAGFSYTVADGRGGFSTGSVVIDVSPVNDAPVASLPLASQTVRSGSAFAYTLPANAFTDVDIGDSLSYSATLADGNALPSWLSFDAASGGFSGTPGGGAANFQIKVAATDPAGASASQTFALSVTGGNAIPVANADSAVVTEDSQLCAAGNVLTNDRDADPGTSLRVGNPGVRHGTYGTLTLMSNGSYSYALDNCSPEVQGLGVGQQAVDRFSYQSSDGTDYALDELAVTVNGSNDKPWLQSALRDRTLVKNGDVRWQIPAGSFVDRDRNDSLTYSVKQANGAATPSWLKFDSATQTFSGHVPSNTKVSIDIQVTASDGHGQSSVASDVFRISFGNNGGCGNGNEGVGNGEDPPPPGHDHNQNDGPASGPGNPGRRGGGDHDDDHQTRDKRRDDDDEWTKGWGDGRGGKGKEKDFAYLDLKLIDHHRDALGDDHRSKGNSSNDGDFYRRWAEMESTLGRMLAESERMPAWLNPAHGADPTGLAGIAHGGPNPMRGAGVDPISLSAGADTCLKGFRGLQEGISRLG